MSNISKGIVSISGVGISNKALQTSESGTFSAKLALAKYLVKAGDLRAYTAQIGTAGTSGTSGSYGFGQGFANQDVNKILSDFENFKKGEGDMLFEQYGPGNTLNTQDRLFERAEAYEELLGILHEYNHQQFLKIHKGTPYYFIGWTAFQFRDYSKALYFLDAALSDDMRFPEVKNRRTTLPSVDFFLLRDVSAASGFAIHKNLIGVVDSHLNDFNMRSGIQLKRSDFVDKFIEPFLYDSNKRRSLLTALYTFLLNYEKRTSEIRLRSYSGGSITVFVDELFAGARLLESLLEAAGGQGSVLREKINSVKKIAVKGSSLFGNQTLADAELKFRAMKSAGADFQDCVFSASYIIRNTTGHSLIWDDQFVNENSYSTLYTCLIDSILWTVYKCWIE